MTAGRLCDWKKAWSILAVEDHSSFRRRYEFEPPYSRAVHSRRRTVDGDELAYREAAVTA